MGVAPAASQSSVADAVAMLMLRKSLDLQQSAAAQLIASVSPATRAPEADSTLGKHVNTHA